VGSCTGEGRGSCHLYGPFLPSTKYFLTIHMFRFCRHLSNQPLARIKHYSSVPQKTNEINESYVGDPDVWESWQILVGSSWEDDPSFTITCACEYIEHGEGTRPDIGWGSSASGKN
jgi:hypothetical protein